MSLDILTYDQHMCAGSEDMRARVWIPPEGALAIKLLPKIGLSENFWPIGISEGPMPELESISSSAGLQLSEASCELVLQQVQDRAISSSGTSIELAPCSCHSLACREWWSLYPHRQELLKVLESDVVRFLAWKLSPTAPSWQAPEGVTLTLKRPNAHALLG